MSSSSGYGFFVKLEDLYTKNRKGKTCISVKGAEVLAPSNATAYGYPEETYVAAANSAGKLLIFKSNEFS